MTEFKKTKRRPRLPGFAGLAFEQYRGGLHRYLLRRLNNTEHARDLAQEVYLRLLRFAEQELVQRPEAYVYRVAYNVLCDFKLREEHNRVSFDSEVFEHMAERLADDAPAPDEVYERHNREHQLERALAELPPMQRAVFLLQKREGLSYAETAQKLGLTVKTVKTYLFRAVCHCRHAVSADDGRDTRESYEILS